MDFSGTLDAVGSALNRILPLLLGPVRHRSANALLSIDRAYQLFDIDREISSFRAITGEEEAATALIKAIQLRRYEHASRFNSYDHMHKAAVMACVGAISNTVQPVLSEFQLIFDFAKPRIDVKLPLSNFNVKGGEVYAVQPVEPLGFTHSLDGTPESQLYDDALASLATDASYGDIKRMVRATANARNTLLYASDAGLPASKATLDSLAIRKRRTYTMLVLAVMVLQSREQLPMVRLAVLKFLSIIDRLPREIQAD